MRWATEADIEALAQFNIDIHSDNPKEPELWLGDWTRDLMNGRHPTTKASDFTVVVDENEGGKIVSSMNLISQTWSYGGIPFAVGRPELVGTDATYRQRGLVRQQFDVIHAKSAARGEQVQAITGIPWYYRQFGYEMVLDLGGGRNFFWGRTGHSPDKFESPYTIRPAQKEDVSLLVSLYKENCQYGLINRVRDARVWEYELFEPSDASPYQRNVDMVVTAESQEAIAYVEYKLWGGRFVIRELGVAKGVSWRPVVMSLLKYFKDKATKLNKERDNPIYYISFSMGQSHPAYDVIAPQLEAPFPSYAWYIRLVDVPGFIQHIAPLLEERLAKSLLVNHSGTHRINFFRSTMALVFENGRLKSTDPFDRKQMYDADARFPDLSFLHLLFGRLTYEELKIAYPDCSINSETAVLFNILFPKQASNVVGLG